MLSSVETISSGAVMVYSSSPVMNELVTAFNVWAGVPS
jgi:hypothetical protein